MSAKPGGDAARISELEALVNYLQETREHEKHLLARQLHDHFGSVLISAKMDIESVSVRLAEAPPELATRLRRAQSALEEAVELKRRLIEDLRPSLLDNLGLPIALDTDHPVPRGGRRIGQGIAASISEKNLAGRNYQ
jgi:signal transduction histidine kinase